MTKELTDTQIYNDYADRYMSTKRNTLMNILYCGKILNEAKDSMPHGMFTKFLEDHRVSESPRTSQRLMTIYRNYRHILDKDKDKATKLTGLGVSHLLELRKLPDRFKKEIEVVKEIDGHETKEMVSVIDEEKLSDFLNTKIDIDGKMQHVRDLPVSQMKKYINEVQGIYEAPSGDSIVVTADDSDVEGDDDISAPVADARFGRIIDGLAGLASQFDNMIEYLGDIDDIDFTTLPDADADEIKSMSAKVTDKAETFMVRLISLKGRIE